MSENLVSPIAQFSSNEISEIRDRCIEIVSKVSQQIQERLLSGQLRDESTESGGFSRLKTNLDRISDELLKESLRREFSGIPVVSEESLTPEFESSIPYQSGPYFIADPIDGTSHLVHGDGQWLINLALCLEEEAIIGVSAVASEGRVYAGAKGMPSLVVDSRNTSRTELVRLTSDRKLVVGLPSVLDLGGNAEWLMRWREFASLNHADSLQFGTAYSYLKVADGTLDVFANFSGNFHWDTAAQQVILEGVGCQLVEIDWKNTSQVISERSRLRYGLSMLKDSGHIAVSPKCSQLDILPKYRIETPKAESWWKT